MNTTRVKKTIALKENQFHTWRIIPWNGFGLIFLFILSVVCVSCNNNQVAQKYKDLYEHDSLLIVQTQEDDSAIKGYVYTMNEIQDNLEQIKTREKVISISGESKSDNTVLADIKTLDELIIKNHRELYGLQERLKKLSKKDTEMEAIVTHLNNRVAEQDAQISILQSKLAKINAAYREITAQFNDSILVIQSQSQKIASMATAMNTVYYAIGTMKELKDSNVIKKSGGFAGIGRNAGIKPDFNTTYFTKSNSRMLHAIPLHAKFRKLISNHPEKSYKITGNDEADSLLIIDPSAFWNISKYLVIAIK